jgi:hypothetical protein
VYIQIHCHTVGHANGCCVVENYADPSFRAVKGVGQRTLACWDCGFESQWPRGLGRGSTAVSLLGLWVPISPGAWMFVLCCMRTTEWNISNMKKEGRI